MRLEAFNDVIIVRKDASEVLQNDGDMKQIPYPYSGVISSVGFESDAFSVGERIAFCDVGGLYIRIEDEEYVVLSPSMVVGKF